MAVNNAIEHLRSMMSYEDREARQMTPDAFNTLERIVNAFAAGVAATCGDYGYAIDALHNAGLEDEDIRNIGLGNMLDTVDVRKICPMCGKEHQIEVSMNAYDRYYGGTLIQDAFPDLNPVEREFIKTGYCPECQKLLFGTDIKSEQITEVRYG